MKKYCLLAMFFSFLLFAICGCADNQNTTNYNDYDKIQAGYNEGYDEGYFWGFEEGLSVKNFEDEYFELQRAVISLMYDYEYEAVKTLLKYCPEVVGSFLEQEFGTSDISEIIDYLESNRKIYPDTIVGKCKYCGEDVIHAEAIICYGNIYETIEPYCAHKDCDDKNQN